MITKQNPPIANFEIVKFQDNKEIICTHNQFLDMLKWYLSQKILYIPGKDILTDTIFNHLDYITLSDSKNGDACIEEHRWLFSFVVKGSNEGHYFHVACYDKYKNFKTVITAKTLSENVDVAGLINYHISKFILEYL